MKIALVPLRMTVGDFEGTSKKILKHIETQAKNGASLVVFPELSLCGYPAQDLLLRKNFRERAEKSLASLQKEISARGLDKTGILLGTIRELEVDGQRCLFNSAVLLHQGKAEWRYKTLIPGYDVFNERRYFSSSLVLKTENGPIEFQGKKIGILVCEDSWDAMQVQGRQEYTVSPTERLAKAGAEILINLSASPYELRKVEERVRVLSEGAKKAKLPLLYVNHLGADDEIIFAGETYYFNNKGELQNEQDLFLDQALLVDTEAKATKAVADAKKTNPLESLRQALVWGIRDYAEKNRFQKVVLGISGGIDSALVAALAAEALGPQNVIGLSMPSKFSSVGSIEDAETLARNLGIVYKNLPIKFIHSTLLMGLKPYFQNLPDDSTEENIQARLRGIMVMSFSNKFRALALATGNKSEFAVGYSTLYGDSCGALAPIGDLYKTQVYELARFINKFQVIIPETSITKAPSAELRPNQTDQDSLPPYPLLDAILERLVEGEMGVEEAVAALAQGPNKAGEAMVREIAHKLELAEFKRRQCPPILKLSAKAFGMGRRYPITASVY